MQPSSMQGRLDLLGSVKEPVKIALVFGPCFGSLQRFSGGVLWMMLWLVAWVREDATATCFVSWKGCFLGFEGELA